MTLKLQIVLPVLYDIMKSNSCPFLKAHAYLPWMCPLPFVAPRQFPDKCYHLSDSIKKSKLGNYLRNNLRNFLRIFLFKLAAVIYQVFFPIFCLSEQFNSLLLGPPSISKLGKHLVFSEGMCGMAKQCLACCRPVEVL